MKSLRDLLVELNHCEYCGGKLLTCGPTNGYEHFKCEKCGVEVSEVSLSNWPNSGGTQ